MVSSDFSMGTSINHASPNTTGWSIVAACYDDARIPPEEVATEVWRAATASNDVFIDQVSSDHVGAILEGVAPSRHHRLVRNSIAGELAMRAAAIQGTETRSNESAVVTYFRQLTAYFVSRDIAGHVGPSHRCQTFAEVQTFKNKLESVVAQRVSRLEGMKGKKAQSWSENVARVIEALTTR